MYSLYSMYIDIYLSIIAKQFVFTTLNLSCPFTLSQVLSLKTEYFPANKTMDTQSFEKGRNLDERDYLG